MARHGVELHLAFRPARIRSEPAVEAKVRSIFGEARQNGVMAHPWILLPEADGYWSGKENAEATFNACRWTMDWLLAEGLPSRWLIVDTEPPLDFTNEASRLLRERKYLRLLVLLRHDIDPPAFARSREKYRELVAEAHRRGFRVMVVTYPPVLEGRRWRTSAVEDALNIPVSGIDWDRVSFMVYRTVYAGFLGRDPGPGLVRYYAKQARALFGEAGAVDLGLAGEDFYTDPASLADDVAAARAGGAARAHVFSMEGLLRQGSVERWLNTLHPKSPATGRPVNGRR